jgi:mono/diheme cytochrome c family protein
MKITCARRLILSAWLVALSAILPAAHAATAPENYEKHCASCHGSDGKARTRLGRKSGAKDLTDKERMAKLTDADAANGIKNGRKNSRGEVAMDPFGNELNDKEISELVAYVRTFAK